MSLFKDLNPKKNKQKSFWRSSLKKVPLFQQSEQTEKVSESLTKRKVNTILKKAEAEANRINYEAQEAALEIREQAESHFGRISQKLFDKQSRIDKKMNALVKKESINKSRQGYLRGLETDVASLEEQVSALKDEYLDKIEKASGMPASQVKEDILKNYEKRLDYFKAHLVSATESKIEEDSDSLLRDILTLTMLRGANNYTAEYVSPVVQAKNKRVLKNLRGTKDCNKEFFEKLADVELIFDENNRIRINSIDSVNRELSRQVIKKLLQQRGRINPARIRRVYRKVERHLEKLMFKAGRDLCYAVGVYNLPKDIMQKLGKFKYRYSYGQNMIEHTLEETLIGISLAHELNVDSNVVRLGCLFHDIGKVIHDDEGTHVETGVAYLKEYNMPQSVIDCVAQSHEDEPFSSIESIIVHIADGISGARPAARHSDHEFTNRIKYLEATPLEYKGVKDAYAIQAGREVRVVVDPKVVGDDDLVKLANDLRDRIKAEITYPGSVTVNVIRETRTNINIAPPQKKANQQNESHLN